MKEKEKLCVPEALFRGVWSLLDRLKILTSSRLDIRTLFAPEKKRGKNLAGL